MGTVMLNINTVDAKNLNMVTNTVVHVVCDKIHIISFLWKNKSGLVRVKDIMNKNKHVCQKTYV